MLRRWCLFISRSPRLALRHIAGVALRARDYWHATPTRRRFARVSGIVLFACMSLAMMANEGCQGCYQGLINAGTPPNIASALTGVDLYTPHRGRASIVKARPMLTGIDGSQTGNASFLGNFTSINQGYFFMFRAAGCSLTQILGTTNFAGAANLTAATPNYERTLHRLASLTTTDDLYPLGCVENTTGISSRVAVAVGRKPTGSVVFAMAEGNGNNNAVFIQSTTANLSTTTFTALPGLTAASALATADLNGDGNGDLVVVNDYNAASPYVTILLGNGDGTFQAPVDYSTAGNMSVAAVIDDVNNDGKLDIVAVSDTQQISVLLGNGDGTFQPAQSFAAPTLPGYTSNTATPILGLITADVNKDGNKDIVCSNGLVLIGNGKGAFTPVSTPAFPYSSASPGGFGPGLASGDLNKDGKLDLVFDDGSTISTWLGNGDGTFNQGRSYAAINNSGYVTVIDLDGDGNLDIYTGLANGGIYSGDDTNAALAYFLMGNGDGTFQGAPLIGNGAYTGNNLADVTGSGTLDLITNGVGPNYSPGPTFTVQLGTGKGTFNPASTITAPASFVLNGSTIVDANTVAASAYAVADINGDGKADLVFSDNGLSYINPHTGLPNGYPGSAYFTAISNGDGTFETPVPHAFPQIAPPGNYDSGVDVSGLQITNFSKGGKPGLIFFFNEVAGGPGFNLYNQGFAVLPGNGDGTFQAPVITTTYSSNTAPNTNFVPVIAAIADLNGDGNPDLVVINNTYAAFVGPASTVEVFLGNGDGTFKAPTTVTTPANPTAIVLADFNNDRKLDIAVVCGAINATVDQLAVSLGNGDGTFAAPATLNISSDINGGATLAAADFNGDGNVDLALLNAFGYSGILYGNGEGAFTSVNTGSYVVPKDLLNIQAGGAAVAVDLNGDGKPDILAGNTTLINIYGSAPNLSLAASTTVLGASATTTTAGSSVTLTATVTGPSGNVATPTGNVTFLNGTTTLGTVPLNSSGVANYPTSALPLGSDSITAVYAGDFNFSGSTSNAVGITVNPALVGTATALSASATSALIGTSLTFTALVSPASGSVTPGGTVTFFDGGASIGVGSLNASGDATLTTASLTAGSHSITAQYGGNTTFAASTSNAEMIAVTAPPPDFSLSISPSSGTAPPSNQVFALVTVTPVNGFTGTVSFACSGLPSGVTCGFNPATLTPAGSAINTVVSFSSSATASSQPGVGARRAPISIAAFGLGLWLLARKRRYTALFKGLAVLLFALALTGIGGCVKRTAPETSTVTINAASGSISHAATYSLTSTN